MKSKHTLQELEALAEFVEDRVVAPSHISLIEKLQRLLDEPCEWCNDGADIKEKDEIINRLAILLFNTVTVLEEKCCKDESLLGTELQDEIGITDAEYRTYIVGEDGYID